MASKTGHIEVKPLTINTGAEIHGVDLTQPLTPEEIKTIRDALLQWGVVFFREQFLDHAQHIDFARQFGEPTLGHEVFGHHADYPEIYPVTKHRKAFAARPKASQVWTDWHTDVTAAINPPWASILRAVVVPPYGGDTQWTNMSAVYRSLSPTMQGFVAQLRAVHQFMSAQSGENAKDYNDMVDSKALVSEHPMVIVHPETGEPSLYTNSEFVHHIAGLNPDESDALLRFLWAQCVRPEYTVRFRWEPGSIAFWDNRFTQHLAIRDVYQTDFERELYRVTLNGEVPVGVDGKSSTSLSGEPIIPV